MANKNRGESDLKIGGKTYTLKFGWNAIAQIETVLDKGINEILPLIQDPASFRGGALIAVLWGVLRHHHGELTLEDAGDLLDEAGPAAVSEALMVAISHSSIGEEAGNPQKASP
jgi:hypothetical protein